MDNQSSASPTADASESTRRTVGVCTGLCLILALALSTVLSVLVTIIAALLGHNGETMETVVDSC